MAYKLGIAYPDLSKELQSLRRKVLQREKCLRRLRLVSYITGAISGCLLVVGTAAVLVTAPKYSYPITVGGGCFFGFMGIIKCLTVYWMCYEVEKMAKEGDVSMLYRRFSWRGTQWILIWLNLIGCILAVVFSGVLTTKACIEVIRGTTNSIFVEACTPYPTANLVLSVFIILLSAVLLAMYLAVHLIIRHPVMKDFRRRTEDLECNGKLKISTLTVTRVPALSRRDSERGPPV